MADVIPVDGDVVFESGDVIIDGLNAAAGNILRLIFPVELGETHDQDLALEEAEIGYAEQAADVLLDNVFPDTAVALLPDWERVLEITPASDASVAQRQTACVAKLRALGGLSIPYFTALAASYGYTIEITEYQPFRVGINRMGDRLYVPGIVYLWQVDIVDAVDPVISEAALEAIFEDLKPAHTAVQFGGWDA